MDELEAAIAVLMGHSNRAEVKELLHKKGQPIAQMFIDMGHAIGEGGMKPKLDELQAKLDAAESVNVDLTQKVEQLQNDKPDIAGMQRQHEEALERQKAQLKGRAEAAEAALIEREKKAFLDSVFAKLSAEGIEGKKLRKPWAKVAVQDSDLHKRLEFKPDGSLIAFQAGTKTPILLAAGQSMADVIAREIIEGTTDTEAFDASDIDEGSGVEDNHRAGKPKQEKANIYDKIRADAEAAVAGRAEAPTAVRAKKFG